MTKKLDNPKWWSAIEAYCANPSISMPKLSKIVSIPRIHFIDGLKKKSF